MRCIPRPSLRAVFTGDVVAFNSPLAGSGTEHVMVRRVAAMEGEELITDDPADGSYTIPEGALCCCLLSGRTRKVLIDDRALTNCSQAA